MPNEPEAPDARELQALLEDRDQEIRRLRLTLDVLSPVDPVTGLLNRNGVLDAIQDGLNWLIRRNETFAVMAIDVPALGGMADGNKQQHQQLLRHLEAVLATTLRSVDKVGHVDPHTFVVVLRDFKTEGTPALIERATAVLEMESAQTSPPTAIEPRFATAIIRPNPAHRPGSILQEIERLRDQSRYGSPLVVEL